LAPPPPQAHGSLRASAHSPQPPPAVRLKKSAQPAQSAARSWTDSPVHAHGGDGGDGGDGAGVGGGGGAAQVAQARVWQAPSVQLLPPHGVTPSPSQQPPAALLQQLAAAQFVSRPSKTPEDSSSSGKTTCSIADSRRVMC
jgi:hypothetical protein